MKVNAINGINQSVSFEKRSKCADKSQAQHQTSPMKAVPLAVLIAMSPLNAPAQNTSAQGKYNTVEKLRMEQILDRNVVNEKADLLIYYNDTDNNSSTIENLNLRSSNAVEIYIDEYNYFERYDFDANAKSLVNYKFNILGDDGKSYGTWKYKQLVLTEKYGDGRVADVCVSNPKILEQIEKFIYSERNKAVEIENVNDNVVSHRTVGLSSFKKLDTSWIEKVKQTPYNFGHEIFDAQFKTSIGDYKMTGVSDDGNPNNFETILLERNDGLKCKLDGIRQLNISVETNDGYKENIQLNCIDVSWPKVGKFTIHDDELFNAFFQLVQNDANNNKAIKVSVAESSIGILQSGTVVPLKYNEKVLVDSNKN